MTSVPQKCSWRARLVAAENVEQPGPRRIDAGRYRQAGKDDARDNDYDDRGVAELLQDVVGAGGLAIAGDGLFVARAAEIAELALRHRLPAIFLFPPFTVAVGLMSYSSSDGDTFASFSKARHPPTLRT
jgi:hypothetical protein